MCGIVGVQGQFHPSVVAKMAAKVAHRGPDSCGAWHSPTSSVAFAHQRLSIIDVSPAGSQPMIDPADDCVIVFNGEIYNFRELRCALTRQGYSFRGHSDTEVLLALYKSVGEAMLPLLN